jgi:hypothetical protein
VGNHDDAHTAFGQFRGLEQFDLPLLVDAFNDGAHALAPGFGHENTASPVSRRPAR